MNELKVEWVPDTQLFDNPPVATKIDGFWKSCTPVPVVRLAQVDKVIAEAVRAMERLVEMRSVLEPSVVVRASLFLASPLVAAWRTRQEGKV